MGYLREKTVEVLEHSFKIRELSYADYDFVMQGDEEDGRASSLRAVLKGVVDDELTSGGLEGIGEKLPPRMVARLAREIMKLSALDDEEDPEGNSEGTQTDASSSD